MLQIISSPAGIQHIGPCGAANRITVRVHLQEVGIFRRRGSLLWRLGAVVNRLVVGVVTEQDSQAVNPILGVEVDYRLDRVKGKCKENKSYAIAHGLDD